MLAQVFSYVLLFIIKCRFPSHKSFAEIIRHRYNGKVLPKVRKLKSLILNYGNVSWTMNFLRHV